MKRSVMSELERWSSDPERKPLVIKGVRQCGKTYIMKEFGNAHYSDVAYFNFEEEDISGIFDRDLKVDRLVTELGISRTKAITEETLIIFDEIQACPRAITSLKYFCEDGRYDVMCAGSLLGIQLAESSPPVGKVDMITMYPMSFPEFLAASGEELLVELIEKDPSDPAVERFRDRLIDHYRQYLSVGGLPQAVSSWTRYHSPEKVDSILRALKELYMADISRYGRNKVRENGEHVWRSVPAQLARDNNRFVMGHVREGQRARDLWSSVDWLQRAGLVHLVPVTVGRDVPSFTSDPSVFKLYCFDTGILRVLADLSFNTVFDDGPQNALYRGAVTENYVLLELRKLTGSDIFCWRSGNSAEVDFLLRIGDAFTPVEVKSGTRIGARSLGVYLDSHGGRGVVVSPRPLESKERIVNVPLFMVWMIGDCLSRDGSRRSFRKVATYCRCGLPSGVHWKNPPSISILTREGITAP